MSSVLSFIARIRCGTMWTSYAEVSPRSAAALADSPTRTRLTSDLPLAVSLRIVSGSLAELLDVDFGPPLHTVVLCGHMHDVEQAMFDRWHWNRQHRAQHAQQLQQQQHDTQTAQWETERKERRAADEARKSELLRRKQDERDRQEAEKASRKQQLLTASAAAALDASEDETDGVEMEPLL